jgi:thiol:disulfide interchange protein DsbC
MAIAWCLPRLAAMALATFSLLTHADEEAMRKTLARVFPQAEIKGIAPTPVAGLFEAAIDDRIYYITEDGRYLLGGPLVDALNRANLTEARLATLNAIPWNSLPLDLAIRRVVGKGTRQIAIFEDPDCPYCKQLEQNLAGIGDVTIYVLLYPLDELHPDAARKSRAIWCSKDRAKAWDGAMRDGAVPANAGTCDNPVATIAQFGRRHRISGTPTLVLSDGRRLVGAIPRNELEKQLSRVGKSNKGH